MPPRDTLSFRDLEISMEDIKLIFKDFGVRADSIIGSIHDLSDIMAGICIDIDAPADVPTTPEAIVMDFNTAMGFAKNK